MSNGNVLESQNIVFALFSVYLKIHKTMARGKSFDLQKPLLIIGSNSSSRAASSSTSSTSLFSNTLSRLVLTKENIMENIDLHLGQSALYIPLPWHFGRGLTLKLKCVRDMCQLII